ncbi:MAG TPA: hypothetical protein DCM08_13100 [Microscillaceae bacterium]|nr:hypothetical protein [Microscillaceae bacterium]
MKWNWNWFKDLKLLTKIQITIFFVSTMIQAILAITSYYQGKSLLEEKAFQFLENLTASRKKAIESYFTDLQKQAIVLGQNPVTIDALFAFQKTFQSSKNEIDGTELLSVVAKVKSFYENDFLPKLIYNSLNQYTLNRFIPTDKEVLALQYHFIANNPNPVGYKSKFTGEGVPLSYAEPHKKYHKAFLSYLTTFDFYDLMLVDLKGNVLYTVQKEVDFASNFITSVYRNSNAAKVFLKAASSSKKDEVVFADYDHYEPSYYKPNSFLAVPIFDNDAKVGVLVLQIATERIDQIITNNLQWEKDGLGTSGEVAMIGPDYKVRTNTRSLLSDVVAYTNALRDRKVVDSVTLQRIKRMNTTILLRIVSSKAIQSALSGKVGSSISSDFRGNEVMDVYTPVNFLGVQWAMITEIDAAEIFSSVYNFRNQLLLMSAIIFVLQTFVGFFLARGLSRPMLKIKNDIKLLSEGIFPPIKKKIYKDELGEIRDALNKLIVNTMQASEFAENIGKGNFGFTFSAKSSQDVLGRSLIDMRDNLRKVSFEESVRSWLNTGKANFNELLRENSENFEELGKAVISSLVKYLGALQGAFFIYREEDQRLTMIGSYANNRQKYLERNLQVGEGLVGQVYLEKETLYLEDVPDTYTQITSGLGETKPRSILIVPVKGENQVVYGVIEIASLEKFEDYRIQFVEEIAETIANTLIIVSTNEQTQSLLSKADETKVSLVEQNQKVETIEQQLKETSKKLQEKEVLLLNAQSEIERQIIRHKSNQKVLRKTYTRLRRQEKMAQKQLTDTQERETELLYEIEQLKIQVEDLQSQLASITASRST